MVYYSSHGTLPHISYQGSHMINCYYHQDLFSSHFSAHVHTQCFEEKKIQPPTHVIMTKFRSYFYNAVEFRTINGAPSILRAVFIRQVSCYTFP